MFAIVFSTPTLSLKFRPWVRGRGSRLLSKRIAPTEVNNCSRGQCIYRQQLVSRCAILTCTERLTTIDDEIAKLLSSQRNKDARREAMPSDRRERSGSAGSARSNHSRASSSMGLDGGEAGRKMAAEDELIRSERQETNAFCNAFWVSLSNPSQKASRVDHSILYPISTGLQRHRLPRRPEPHEGVSSCR